MPEKREKIGNAILKTDHAFEGICKGQTDLQGIFRQGLHGKMRCESDCGHHEGVAENTFRAEYAVRGGAVAKLCV